MKGESSGHTQDVIEIRYDCDADCLLVQVNQNGPGACHTKRTSASGSQRSTSYGPMKSSAVHPGYVTIALRGDFFFAGERRVAASLSFGVTYF